MTQFVGKDKKKQERRREEPAGRGEAAKHGHTGEGAASALAYLIALAERVKRQDVEPDEGSGSDHP